MATGFVFLLPAISGIAALAVDIDHLPSVCNRVVWQPLYTCSGQDMRLLHIRKEVCSEAFKYERGFNWIERKAKGAS
ncbi:hypothetical protein AAC03nite_37850 [Alicyclobacillus acidoterrestris]|nr:hypothetical protein AAC03nite_37850 [Alicyclobacillus acidoterrestris]